MRHGISLLQAMPADAKSLARSTGFKALLAWHYIVLFTPLFATSSNELLSSCVFMRQFLLYFSLALAFLALAVFGKAFLQISKPFSSLVLHGSVGLLSVLATATAIMIPFFDAFPHILRASIIILLGCCEATSMYLWIHHHLKSKAPKRRRALVIDMISGVLIAFFALSLQQPLSYLVVALLPGLAACSLFMLWSSGYMQPKEIRKAIPKHAQHLLAARFIRNHAPSAVFAFTFGLMQGSFIEIQAVFFMAPVPSVLLGIIMAGFIIYLIKEKSTSYEDIDTMHRYALLLLVIGVMGVSFFRNMGLEHVSQAALLAGFNLFDFGALILSMSMTRRVGLIKVHYIDAGRSLVYMGFSLGLLAGYFGCATLSDSYNEALINTIGGIAIVLLVATILMKADRKAAIEPVLIEGTAAVSAGARVVADAVDAGTVALTPVVRGTTTVADMRYVSVGAATTTAATITAAATAADSAVNTIPSHTLVAAHAGAVLPSSVSTHAIPATLTHPAVNSTSNNPATTNPDSTDTPIGTTSWLGACNQISKTYRLSPRESEVFLLLAKGRNAEYIQGKLVISLHTAKSHIASIYQKLGVHSIQEVLDLIDLFTEQ